MSKPQKSPYHKLVKYIEIAEIFLIGLLLGALIMVMEAGPKMAELNDEIQSYENQLDISEIIVSSLMQTLEDERNMTDYWRNQSWAYSNESAQKDEYIEYLEGALRNSQTMTNNIFDLNSVKSMIMLNMSYSIAFENFAISCASLLYIQNVSVECEHFFLNKTMGTFFLEAKNVSLLFPSSIVVLSNGEAKVLGYTKMEIGYLLIDGKLVGDKISLHVNLSDFILCNGESLNSLENVTSIPCFEIQMIMPSN